MLIKNKFIRVARRLPPISGSSLPLSLIYFINNECNARCSHCFIYYDESVVKNNPRYQTGNLSLDEIEKLTKSLRGELGAVYLTGGEPFLRHDIEKIVDMFIEN